MSYEEFSRKFEELYFQERNRQEMGGVSCIRSQEICRKFKSQNRISMSNLSKYFSRLKSEGLLFAVIEDGQEIIEWVD